MTCVASLDMSKVLVSREFVNVAVERVIMLKLAHLKEMLQARGFPKMNKGPDDYMIVKLLDKSSRVMSG